MTLLLAQAQKSGIIQLLESINSDILGVVLILATIGIFVTSIIIVVTISSSVTNVKLMKLHQSMVKDLLSQGYSVDDIERLTSGNQGIGRQVKKLVRAATDRLSNHRNDFQNQPVPPVKQTA